MRRIQRLGASAAALASLVLAGGVAHGTNPAAQASKSIVGTWTGDFGAGNWTFKFSVAGNTWAGQYTYPQYKGWNPVINLAGSSGRATFSLKARTAVDFDLKLDAAGNALTGTVRYAHGMTPTSKPVVLPVELKRV